MSDVVGAEDYEPFKIYKAGEKRPFDFGGDEAAIVGCLRWAPISDDGTVALSAESLRDLCHHVYRCAWRFGDLVGAGRVQGEIDQLVAYVDDAKRAAGDERVSGEPLALFITRIIEERDRWKQIADRWED